MGHGQGYKYPHDFAGHYVPEDYLPDELVGEPIYRPTDSGFESELARRLAAIAERKRSR
jgi:putative ATPase